MKQFFKQVAAVIVGIFAVGLFMSVISFIMFLTMVLALDSKPDLSKGTVLHIKLQGSIVERAEDNPLQAFLGNSAIASQGLDNMLKAIKVAANNDKIAGIYLEGGIAEADFASLEELRKALKEFKKSGKFILAYGDNFMQGSYYVASAADSVLVNPSGMIDWHGIASQPIFYKNLMEKVGVKMQVFRVGTYKSFVEPYTRTDMSEANRAQVRSFIGDIWSSVCKDVAADRHISADSLNAYADRYTPLTEASEYVRMKLADRTAYADEVREQLRRLAGTSRLRLISPENLALHDEPAGGNGGEIAVYYAHGGIVGGEEGGMFGSGAQIVGPKVVADLDKLANNDNVKAVVLRINSGGGSAYASEQMWRAIQLLKKKKPVVVSMGGMAASGGYYMACSANHIIAEPTTLTGSIGIFGMVPDASELLTEKLGLNFDVVKTNEASDFGAMGRAFNAGESQAMQAYVDRGYALFLKRVAEGRKMKTSEVDSIAQGRVWTGAQALRIKLVDQLGTLNDAIAYAAKLAKVKDYGLGSYPQRTGWLDNVLKTYHDDYMEQQVRVALGEYYRPLRFVSSIKGTDCLQARLPFELNIK